MTDRESSADDWSHAEQALFDAARSEYRPSAADRSRVRSALNARIAASDGVDPRPRSAGATNGAPAARPVPLGLAWVGTAVVVAGAFVLLVTQARRASEPAPASPRSPSVVHLAPARASQSVATPAPAAHPLVERDHGAPRLTRPKRPVSRMPARDPAAEPVIHRAEREAEPERAREAEPEREREPEPVAAPERSLGTAREHEAVPATKRARTGTPALDAMQQELALIEKMQAALRRQDPARALQLSAEHERRWPIGAFGQEREGVAVLARCLLGSGEGPARARSFLASYPRSPLATRIATACKLGRNGP